MSIRENPIRIFILFRINICKAAGEGEGEAVFFDEVYRRIIIFVFISVVNHDIFGLFFDFIIGWENDIDIVIIVKVGSDEGVAVDDAVFRDFFKTFFSLCGFG